MKGKLKPMPVFAGTVMALYAGAQWIAAPIHATALDGAIGRDYGIRGVPAVFILGPGGDIRFSTVGYASELGLRLRLRLAHL